MPNNNTESPLQTSSLDLVGRTELVANLINKLRDNYFVSVSGPVGSGKSTLVKNLLPQELFNNKELEGRAGNDWRVVYTCPGVNPIGNLAADIRKASGNLAEDILGKGRGLFKGDSLDENDQDLALEKFRNNSSILTQLYEKALSNKIHDSFNLLLIVDQMHDLFRYQRFWSGVEGKKESLEPIAGDDILFINLLLNAKNSTAPIYVILVSDNRYVGNFAPYRGLPEAMNNSSFYVPNLRDVELGQFLDKRLPSIPPKDGESEQKGIALKELNDELDELKKSLKQEFKTISEKQDGSALLKLNLFLHLFEQKRIETSNYTPAQLATDIGGSKKKAPLQGVIKYFMEQYLGVKEPTKNVQYLLQALTGIAGENQPVRNPVTMEQLELLLDRKPPETKEKPLETPSEEVKILANLWGRQSAQSKATPILQESIEKPLDIQQIYNELTKFNTAHEAFILLPKRSELSKSSVVDLNYDALLSSWSRLEMLIKQEWEYAQVYRNFVRDAILYYTNPSEENAKPGKGFPVTAFASIKKWMEVCRPNEAWAKRYLPKPPKEILQLKKHKAFAGEDENQLTNLRIAKKFYTEIEDYFENQKLQEINEKKSLKKQRTIAFISLGIAIVFLTIAIFYFFEIRTEKEKSETYDFLNSLSFHNELIIPNDIYMRFDSIQKIRNAIKDGINSEDELLKYLLKNDKISIGSDNPEVVKISYEALKLFKKMINKDEKKDTLENELLAKYEKLKEVESKNINKKNYKDQFNQTQYPALYLAFYAFYWEKKEWDKTKRTTIEPNALDVHEDGRRYAFGDKDGYVYLILTNSEYAQDKKPASYSLASEIIELIKVVSFGKNTLYICNELGEVWRLTVPVTMKGHKPAPPKRIFKDSDKTIFFLKPWQGEDNYLLVSNPSEAYFLERTPKNEYKKKVSVQLPTDARIACRNWSPKDSLFLIGCKDSVLIYHLDPRAKEPIKKIYSIKNDSIKTKPVTFTSVAIKNKQSKNSNDFYLAMGTEAGDVYICDAMYVSSKRTKSKTIKLSDFKQFKNTHLSTVTCMDFNPSAQQMASASYDGGIRLWNLNKLNAKRPDDIFLRYFSNVEALAFLNKNELVVYSDLFHFVEPTNITFMRGFLKNN